MGFKVVLNPGRIVFVQELLLIFVRYAKRTEHLKQLELIHDMCAEYSILFKINTVVCSANWHEDLSEMIETLDPVRWKVC